MAEKYVQMGKMFNPTPSVSEFTSVDGAKKRKLQLGLWTCEGRMFYEKVIFLNKSTTKFVIVGIDPVAFSPKMKFCDRATGRILP